MPTYKCYINRAKKESFKINWPNTQIPDKWAKGIEAQSNADARKKALRLLGAPVTDRKLGDFSDLEPLSIEWIECEEISGGED